MVTFREVLADIARVIVTLVTWLYCIPFALFIIAWVVIGDRLWPFSVLGNFLPFYFLPVLVLLIFGLLTRARRGLVFSLPLMLVGVVVYAPLFIPRLPVAAASESLQVITFNVSHLNRDSNTLQQWISQQNADVIFLQEVPLQMVQSLAYQMGAKFPYINSYQANGQDFVSLLLSRHALIGELELETGTSVYSLLRYAIRWNEHTIALYGVDTVPPLGTPRMDVPLLSGEIEQYLMGYDPTNRDQALLKALSFVQEEPLPSILMGDFGLSDQSSLYGRFSAELRDAFREAGYGLGATWMFSNSQGMRRSVLSLLPPLVRMDYVWHTGQFRAIQAVLGPDLGSDHLPLIVQLDWTEAPAEPPASGGG